MRWASSQRGGQLRWLRLAFAGFAAVWLVYAGLTITGTAENVELLGAAVQHLMYAGLLLGAGLMCLARAFGSPDERRVWAALGAGLTLWSFGDIWWIAFFAKAEEIPYPSMADFFWLVSYPPMAYGVWRLISL